MFTTGTYGGAPRLVALTWGAEDLADALGASENRNPDGSYGFTYELARSLCLCGAAAAGVAAIDTTQAEYKDLAALRKRATPSRRARLRRTPTHHLLPGQSTHDSLMTETPKAPHT